MCKRISMIAVACSLGFFVSACTELGEEFMNDSDQTCADWGSGPPGVQLLCVECDSTSNPKATAGMCGVELTARCSTDQADDVRGIAVGVKADGVPDMASTGTAYLDDDGVEGSSSNDSVICHEQSVVFLNEKHESKCTNALKGNGKTATTFEYSIKYDASKDDC